jgi:hypothetical protein
VSGLTWECGTGTDLVMMTGAPCGRIKLSLTKIPEPKDYWNLA